MSRYQKLSLFLLVLILVGVITVITIDAGRIVNRLPTATPTLLIHEQFNATMTAQAR